MKYPVSLNLFFLFSLLFFAGMPASAQQVLTLEDAVKFALENNYDIRLSANLVKINSNNVSLANAGILPVVGGNFNTNNAIQNSTQVQSNGTETVRNGAKNSNINYGVNLNWTIFNGLQMFSRYEQLKELRKQSEADLQAAVFATVSNVIRAYYDLVQQQQQLTANDTALNLSHYRLRIAKTRYEIGQAAKLDVLNALVDLNTDTTNYLKQTELYKNAKTNLNALIARDINAEFIVADSIQIDQELALDSLLVMAQRLNPGLQSVLIGKRVAELNLKQVKGQRYPAIGFSSGYNFTDSRSALGFATHTSGKGFNYGITATVNIFNGFIQHRNEQNAALQVSSARIQYEQLELNIRTQLTTAYQSYLTSLALVRLEASNTDIARENMDITMDKFKYGNITPLEFREAQRNYIDAVVRFSNARLQAKLAEVALRQLAGNINI